MVVRTGAPADVLAGTTKAEAIRLWVTEGGWPGLPRAWMPGQRLRVVDGRRPLADDLFHHRGRYAGDFGSGRRGEARPRSADAGQGVTAPAPEASERGSAQTAASARPTWSAACRPRPPLVLPGVAEGASGEAPELVCGTVLGEGNPSQISTTGGIGPTSVPMEAPRYACRRTWPLGRQGRSPRSSRGATAKAAHTVASFSTTSPGLLTAPCASPVRRRSQEPRTST